MKLSAREDETYGTCAQNMHAAFTDVPICFISLFCPTSFSIFWRICVQTIHTPVCSLYMNYRCYQITLQWNIFTQIRSCAKCWLDSYHWNAGLAVTGRIRDTGQKVLLSSFETGSGSSHSYCHFWNRKWQQPQLLPLLKQEVAATTVIATFETGSSSSHSYCHFWNSKWQQPQLLPLLKQEVAAATVTATFKTGGGSNHSYCHFWNRKWQQPQLVPLFISFSHSSWRPLFTKK